MIIFNTPYIQVSTSLQKNNQKNSYEEHPNGSARFNMSPSTSSSLFSYGIIEYANDLFKPLFDRLIKAEETDVTPYINNSINMQTCYDQSTDFSGIVEYIDETTNRPSCKRR